MKYFSMFTGVGGFELGIKHAYENYCSKKSGLAQTPPVTDVSSLQPDNQGGHGGQFPDGSGLSPTQNKTADSRMVREQKCGSGLPGGSETVNGTGIGFPQTNGNMLNGLRHTPPQCVGFSEIDKYASQLLQIKWPNIKNYGDATTIDPNQLPDFDLLCGGFPCQAFSVAGKRRGFADTRGTLFFDIARICAVKKPRLILLENVKGLLSHDGGNTFKTIIATLVELGYDLQWQVLNSKNFGVPQNRERVFIVGHIGGQPRPEVFPIGEADGTDGEVELRHDPTRPISPTIRTPSGGYHTPTVRYPLKFLQRNQNSIAGDYSYTVDSVNTGGVKQGARIRRLTPLECERLQGFPDNWTKGFSDNQRYKMMGNAVTTNVVAAVMERIFASVV